MFALNNARAQTILTIAGGGTDDGRPARFAGLAFPEAIALDAAGNLYIADTGNHRIRRVDAATQILTTVAGTGAFVFSGDGGPATSAALHLPEGVAVDHRGNLYIADSFNHRIRKVDAATKLITTVAGIGTDGFAGDGGPASSAELHRPRHVAVDGAGNLFIADSGNHRIRRVDAVTQIMTTVAGNGLLGFSGDGGPATAASLSGSASLAVGPSGDIYIAEGHRIRRVDGATGIIRTVAGGADSGFAGDGEPAALAALAFPLGVSLDPAGKLYIADTGNARIRVVDPVSNIITTFAGGGEGPWGDGGPAAAAYFRRPVAVETDPAGNVYVADSHANRVSKIDAVTGMISTLAGSGRYGFTGDGGPATAAGLRFPSAVGMDPQGNLLVSDSFSHRVRMVEMATRNISTVAGIGTAGFSGDGGPATAAALWEPRGIAVDKAGNLYIADSSNARVRRVDAATKVITTVAGGGSSGDGAPATEARLVTPTGIAVDPSGNIYVADPIVHRVRRIDATTNVITTVAGTGSAGFSGDGGPASLAMLRNPAGVTVDRLGNLYIADAENDRIRKVTAASGLITTLAGSGARGFGGDGGLATAASLWFPYSVSMDPFDNLYIADSLNSRIRKVDSASRITTIAGSGKPGFTGDGGPATAADLMFPDGVAVDEFGNLYIAVTGHNRIRAVFACVTVPAPQPASPSDGSQVLSTAPRLTWIPVRGAFRYVVYLDTANPPRQIVASDLETATFSPSNLGPATQYYWQVVAEGDPFCAPRSAGASPVRTFTTTATCSAPGSFNGSSFP